MKNSTLAVGLGAGLFGLFAWSRARAAQSSAYTPQPPSYTPQPPAYTPPAYTPPAYTPPVYVPPAYTPQPAYVVQGQAYGFSAKTEVSNLRPTDVYTEIEKLGWAVDRANSSPMTGWFGEGDIGTGNRYRIVAVWNRPSAASTTLFTDKLTLGEPRAI